MLTTREVDGVEFKGDVLLMQDDGDAFGAGSGEGDAGGFEYHFSKGRLFP